MAVSKEPTPQERALKDGLLEAGYEVETDRKFRYKTKKGRTGYIKPDICLPQVNLVIEVDGGYHGIPERNISDLKRDECIRSHGWEIIRVKNKTIENRHTFKGFIEHILEHYPPPPEFTCGRCGNLLKREGNGFCTRCNSHFKRQRKKDEAERLEREKAEQVERERAERESKQKELALKQQQAERAQLEAEERRFQEQRAAALAKKKLVVRTSLAVTLIFVVLIGSLFLNRHDERQEVNDIPTPQRQTFIYDNVFEAVEERNLVGPLSTIYHDEQRKLPELHWACIAMCSRTGELSGYGIGSWPEAGIYEYGCRCYRERPLTSNFIPIPDEDVFILEARTLTR